MRNSPDPIDVFVGQRVRDRRKETGLSQTQLGKEIGVTFQQIQKYEKGTNRMGSSRLVRIGRTLGIPVSYFFEGLPGNDNSAETPLDKARRLSTELSLALKAA